MKVYILAYEGDPVQRLINWIKFHKMEYILSYEENLESEGYNLIITSDLVPNTKIFHYIFSKKEFASPCSIRKMNNIYRPSFCIATNQKVQINDYFPIYKKDLLILDDIVTEKTEGILFHICHGTWSRYDVLWSIIATDWYKVDKEYVCRFYYRLWIEAYHKDYIKNKNMRNRVWMREQCCFSEIPNRTKLEGSYNMEELRNFVENHELTFNDCLNESNAYTLDINVTPAQFSLHPFSIHGVYQANPIKRVEVDTSITLVGFYYDLGYDNKPKDGYLGSLDYFCLLKYPLIFFGDEEICNIVKEKRGDLIDYTHLVVKGAKEWDLIKKYKDDFEEMDTELNYRKRRRYSILTCNKVYAVMEAIKINPFFTNNFAWCDPGMYRHELASGIKLEPHILKNVKIPENGVLVPCISLAGGSNHDEYVERGHESMITNMLIASIDEWEKFYVKYNDIVSISFKNGNFSTEQVVFTRLAGIYPDLIKFREFTYHGKSVNSFLSLNWEE